MSNVIGEPRSQADREKGKRVEGQAELAQVLSAYNDFVSDRLKLELDLDQIKFVPLSQIHQTSGREVDLALTLRTGEILISDEVTDVRERFDVIAHELFHRGRMQAGIDNLTINGSQLLEEGIIQERTQRLAERSNMVSQRTKEIYHFEAWVARNLAANIGVESLLDLSHEQIRLLMRKKYSKWADPYDILGDDLAYFQAMLPGIVKQTESLGGSDVDNTKLKLIYEQQLQFEKNKVAEAWGFAG